MSESLNIKEFKNPNECISACELLLTKAESFHNLKLGLLKSIKDNNLTTTHPIYLGIYSADKIIGCALRTNLDRPMAITTLPQEAVEKLVEYLIEKKIALCGVIGEVETASIFRNLWCLKSGQQFKLNIHLGVYEIHKIIMPKTTGTIILGTENEKEIIFNFVKAFCMDCFPNQSNEDESVEKLCSRHITNKSLYLLKNNDQQIVSMAANTRGSSNGGTVSLVYTPNNLRGNGYGSLVTALVTEKILKDKSFANLFTDLTNSTSNSIYQKIGYKMVGENIHFDFI